MENGFSVRDSGTKKWQKPSLEYVLAMLNGSREP
jgi:hypothetical protein